MKKIPVSIPVIVTCALVIIVVAAMLTSERDDARQPYNILQPQAYQYPFSGGQRAALQAYSGPSCAPGSLQVPEVGAEVLPAQYGGLLVTRVYKGSHADRNGLRVGDIIVKFSGKKITSADNFFRAISAASPEAYVKFEVMRAGKPKKLKIMMGKRELDGVIVPPDAAPAHPFAIPG
jgi:S1-C subfamily serine protease